MTKVFNRISSEGFEQIVYCSDPRVGLKAIIALHSTALGAATGGCRMWNYSSEDEALEDVLRLSKGMTYKASLAGLNWGGGKSIIWGDSKTQKSPEFLQRFGEFVNTLSGVYITAKDVGISGEDLRQIKKKTPHVLGIEGEANSSGDPSPATAWGVFHGIRASAKVAFGSPDLKGKKIALQGLGSVSYYLLKHLTQEGAQVIGCDIETAMTERAAKDYGVEIVNPDKIYDVDCDIFSPSALGSTINAQTRPRIKAKVIAGAANNQLATVEDGQALHDAGIVYAPDYAINAGGLINIYYEDPKRGGYSESKAYEHVTRVGQTIETILERSKKENLPPQLVADRMAEERVQAAEEKRRKLL